MCSCARPTSAKLPISWPLQGVALPRDASEYRIGPFGGIEHHMKSEVYSDNYEDLDGKGQIWQVGFRSASNYDEILKQIDPQLKKNGLHPVSVDTAPSWDRHGQAMATFYSSDKSKKFIFLYMFEPEFEDEPMYKGFSYTCIFYEPPR